jgi:hypothetical protein
MEGQERRDFENPFAMYSDFHPFMRRSGGMNEHYTELLQNLRSEDPMVAL